MKKIQIALMMLCFAACLQAQIVGRAPGGGNYKPMTNKNIVTSFLSDREKLQLLQTSPGKPGMPKANSLGAKSTIGVCTADNPAMTSSGWNVGSVSKTHMSINENGFLCLEIGGIEKGYYAIEVNLIQELGGVNKDDNSGIKEYYIAPAPIALLTDMIKLKSVNSKLVFMKELEGGVINKLFIFRTNREYQSSFTFTNAQVSRVNL
jgi:hypothetical protein